MTVDPELLDELEKAVTEEKGILEKGKVHRWLRRTRTATTWCVRRGGVYGGGAEPGSVRLDRVVPGRADHQDPPLAAERRRRPLSFVLTPGQAADSPRFVPVLEGIGVRGPVGRPRTRPGAVAADKAYSSRADRADRAYLRRRSVRGVIPEKADQAANRKKKGSRGGRPVGHDLDLYEDRNTVERWGGQPRGVMLPVHRGTFNLAPHLWAEPGGVDAGRSRRRRAGSSPARSRPALRACCRPAHMSLVAGCVPAVEPQVACSGDRSGGVS
ncbi:transposase [Streptomyces shenzhenensis]|uniref:transposase n=1 Tax=Streptomyces shenzhenensis TaxID=943815 RepID=UPI0015EFEAEA